MHWLDILMEMNATGGGLLTFILFVPFLIIFSFSLWCYFMAVECITYFWPRENTNLLTIYSIKFKVFTLVIVPGWSTTTGTATSKRTTSYSWFAPLNSMKARQERGGAGRPTYLVYVLFFRLLYHYEIILVVGFILRLVLCWQIFLTIC